jgi:hypothetical protein
VHAAKAFGRADGFNDVDLCFALIAMLVDARASSRSWPATCRRPVRQLVDGVIEAHMASPAKLNQSLERS